MREGPEYRVDTAIRAVENRTHGRMTDAPVDRPGANRFTTSRRGTGGLTLGVRMALLPALFAAAATLAVVGLGRRGVGLAIAAGVGLVVLLAIALPIDFLQRGGMRPIRVGRGPRAGQKRRR
jgi:hypothetical protein